MGLVRQCRLLYKVAFAQVSCESGAAKCGVIHRRTLFADIAQPYAEHQLIGTAFHPIEHPLFEGQALRSAIATEVFSPRTSTLEKYQIRIFGQPQPFEIGSPSVGYVHSVAVPLSFSASSQNPIKTKIINNKGSQFLKPLFQPPHPFARYRVFLTSELVPSASKPCQ